MARHYKLVASFKNNYGFYNEQELELGDAVTTLEEMDYITCRFEDQSQLISLLEKDGLISGKNNLSISYNHNGKKNYLNPLFGYPEMMGIIDNLEEVVSFDNGHQTKYKIVSHKSPLFKQKLEEFYSLLGDEPARFFEEIYKDKAPKYLEKFVYNYYDNKNRPVDTLEDEYELRDLKRKIELEFSRYKTFRGYLIFMDKYMKKHPELSIDEKTPNTKMEVEDTTDYDDEEFLTKEEIEEMAKGDDLYHGPKRL